MLKFLWLAIVMCLVLSCQKSQPGPQAAGPGSGGGGDTINPTAVAPEAVASAVEDYGKIAILAWLHAAENKYRYSPEPQHHPYVKLFGGTTTIYDILKTTPVELRFNEPCYDQSGQAKDGSIYAHKAGAICISPLLMAPKLGETTVKEQTLALVLHEMSHLLGTTEDEAIRIQNDILLDFSHIVFDDFWVKPDDAHNEMTYLLHSINQDIQNPTQSTNADFIRLVEFIDTQTKDLLKKMSFDEDWNIKPFLVLSPQMEDRAEAYACLVTNLKNYIYSIGPNQTVEPPSYYQKQLDHIFQGQKEITALIYDNRAVCSTGVTTPEFDKLIIQRIDNQSDLIAALQQEVDFLISFQTELLDYISVELKFIELH